MNKDSNFPISDLATGLTAGILVPLGQMPYSFSLLSASGFVLLFFCLQYENRHFLYTSAAFALAYFLSGQLWLYHSFCQQNTQVTSHDVPAMVTIFLAPAVVVTATSYLYVICRKNLSINRFTILSSLLFSSFWVLFEFIYALLPDSIPLLIAGYTTLGKLWDQVIPVVGILGCSFLLVFCSCLVACIIHHFCVAGRSPVHLCQLVALLIITLVTPSLLLHDKEWTHHYDWRTFHYQMVVNKNADSPDNFSTQDDASPPKLIILGGVTADIERPNFRRQIPVLDRNTKTAFVALMPDFGQQSDLFCSFGEGDGCAYGKQNPLLFPHMPSKYERKELGFDLPLKKRTVVEHPSIDSYRILILDHMKDVLPFLTAETISGAELIVVFDSPGKGQVIRERLLHIDRTRALESGRPVLRYSNLGLSAAIDHTGIIVSRFFPEQNRVDGEIRPATGTTPIMRVGRLGIVGIITLIFLFLCARHLFLPP